jgi:hypothetical protein
MLCDCIVDGIAAIVTGIVVYLSQNRPYTRSCYLCTEEYITDDKKWHFAKSRELACLERLSELPLSTLKLHADSFQSNDWLGFSLHAADRI